MKRISAFAIIATFAFVFFSCGGSTHDEATQVADQIKETVKKNSPGTIATSENNYYMKAKIDGRQWVASHMMPDEDASSSYIRIHGEDGGDYMNFQLWKRGVELGKKIAFDDEHMANLSIEEDAGFWSGKTGQIEITKLDGKWLEGKFSYKATSSSSSKTIDVTEGIFRVPFATDAVN